MFEVDFSNVDEDLTVRDGAGSVIAHKANYTDVQGPGMPYPSGSTIPPDYGTVIVGQQEQYIRLGEPPPSEELLNAILDRLYGQHSGKAVAACGHCAQWGARYCACRHCGAAID